jgi:predicted DCC family thiol-disulfide oxidoreductase YuxK
VSPFTPTVLYDGTCPFCRAQVARLRRLTRHRVAFADAYAPGARDRFPMLPPSGELGEMKFVDADGRLFGGAAAIAQAFILSGGPLGLGARLYAVPPIAWLADHAYRLAAKRRLRLKQACVDESCKIQIKN